MIWTIKRGDRLPNLPFRLLVDGDPLDLTGRTIRFYMTEKNTQVAKVSDGATTIAADQSENGDRGRGEYAWGVTDTDTAGTYNGKLVDVTDPTRPRTFPSKGHFTIEVEDT